jgi:hypothetical protein
MRREPTSRTTSGARITLPPLNVRAVLRGEQIATLVLDIPPGTVLPPLFDAYIAGLAPLRHHVQPLLRPARTPRVAELIEEAAFPVYGPPNTPLGMTLHGLGCERSPWLFKRTGRLTSVSLDFASPMARDAGERELRLATSDARTPNSAFAPVATDQPADVALYDVDGRRYQRFASLEALASAPAAPAPYLIGRMTIAGAAFAARIQYWERSEQETHFWLAGRALGIPPRALLTVLAVLEIVTPDSALCAQYEAERRQWRRRYGQ